MSNPFTSPTLENFEGCEFHCEKGWLPADGDLDAEVDEYDGVVYSLPLLISTSYILCPCSPLWSMNPEMEGVVV